MFVIDFLNGFKICPKIKKKKKRILKILNTYSNKLKIKKIK